MMPTTEIKQQNPRWGSQYRDKKAHAILQTLEHYTPFPLEQAACIDIGCGSGGIAFHLAPYVKKISGIDPEAWTHWSDYESKRDNLRLHNETINGSSINYSSAVHLMMALSSMSILIAHPTRYCKLRYRLNLLNINNAIQYILLHHILYYRKFLLWKTLRLTSNQILDFLAKLLSGFIFYSKTKEPISYNSMHENNTPI